MGPHIHRSRHGGLRFKRVDKGSHQMKLGLLIVALVALALLLYIVGAVTIPGGVLPQ